MTARCFSVETEYANFGKCTTRFRMMKRSWKESTKKTGRQKTLLLSCGGDWKVQVEHFWA